jgi:hypothetical protein
VPPLTQDIRQQIAKQAKGLGDEAKVSIRNIRRDYLDLLKEDDSMSDDYKERVEDDIQKAVDAANKKIDDILADEDQRDPRDLIPKKNSKEGGTSPFFFVTERNYERSFFLPAPARYNLTSMATEKFVLSKKLDHVAFIMDGNGRWAKLRGDYRVTSGTKKRATASSNSSKFAASSRFM